MVSVPFDAGRGLMLGETLGALAEGLRFSTLRCGSWIDARNAVNRCWNTDEFQYPSMRVVD